MTKINSPSMGCPLIMVEGFQYPSDLCCWGLHAPGRVTQVQPPLNSQVSTPGEMFSHFFDEKVLKLLCNNSNKYAVRNHRSGRNFAWSEITIEEMKKYLGLLLYMALLELPKVSDFWRKNTIFYVPFPSTVMSRNRFRVISSNLHISDPAEDALNDQRKGTGEHDRLHRVRPLLEIMRNRCMAFYHPKQHLSVDERMVATKARIGLKQYMKAKPTKWGLKFFVLADVNGYTVDFSLYQGKSTASSGNGLSYDVVTSLVNKDYLGSGYIIYCDNFYTSPLLFRYLGQQGFGACGTYRQGRVGVPTTTENALNRGSPRGSIRWIREHDLLFVKWMDTREVSICTNVHPVYKGETVLRWQKTEDGKRQKLPVPRPTAVGEYNKFMGGVDTSDQMLATHSTKRRTKRWPVTVFQHFLDIAVTNSFILHKELCASRHQKPKTRQQFQEEVAASLLGVSLHSMSEHHPSEDHFPVATSQKQEKAQRASMGRRQCTVCKRSTPWQCEVCRVGLCVQLERNCFRAFHKK
uniref:PiggyBac transposable element-derived protein domain-containing protein n=1 Tax=Poecilia mexicana TaxID=48701 RepID=A0A3B3Y6R7_9TELE